MQNNTYEIAVFGGGCFWCTEAVFTAVKGVVSAMPGYSGGTIPNPTYEQVCEDNTGHVECTKVEFDPSIVSYEDILKVFFDTHDPTTLNRQGNDIGTHYRSVIFYTNENQKKLAENFIAKLESEKVFNKPIVTTIEPLGEFYLAEDYHQKYYENHKDAPYCQIVIAPKLEKVGRTEVSPM